MENKKTALDIDSKKNAQKEKTYVIATILRESKCDMFYTLSLCETIKSLTSENINIIPILINAIDGKIMAINQAITFAWNQNVDGMIFISPDAIWSPLTFLELISSDKDCVSFPVMTSAGIDIEIGDISRLYHDDNTGEIKVLYSSLDFMYLSSYAINNLCRTHHSIEYQGNPTKLVIQSGDIFSGYYNESKILKSRLLELNIETWVNTNHTITTRQVNTYANDFKSILNNLKITNE